MTPQEILSVEQKVADALKMVYDPEIPVNIYDLGLIYEISFEPDGHCSVVMTLTAPNCPVADDLVQQVHDMVLTVDEVQKVDVTLSFDPEWSRERMSQEALLELGML